MGDGDRIIGADLAVAAHDLLAVALQRALLVERLHQHAGGVGIVLPVEQAAELRLGGAGQVGVDAADGRLGGVRLGKLQRLAGDDVHRAGTATFDQARLRRLVHHHLADDLRRQQAVAHAAADGLHLAQHEPVAGADGVAVDQRLGEAGVGAAQAHAIALVEAALAGAGRTDVHTGQALQRVGHVLGRQLADVLGGDDLHVRGGVLLQRQRLGLAVADAGDGDGGQLLGLVLARCGVLVGVLRLQRSGQAQAGDDARG
jgi:hypothetical protein